MYEPIYQPILASKTAALGQIRFGLLHYKGNKQTPTDDVDPLHCHAYLEIYFHVLGSASFLVNGQLYPLRPGDAVVSRANDIHMCVYDVPGIKEHYCLWVGAEGDSIVTEFLKQEGCSPVFHFDMEVWEALKSLLDILEADRNVSELEKTALLLRILMFFQKHPREEETPGHMPREFQRILEDIDSRYPWLQHISEIARDHYISDATLNRWFQKYLHITPKNYLDSKKLSHAAKMLTQGAAVSEACSGAGFTDCSHFIQLFHKKFGQTPLQYKRRCQQTERPLAKG